MNKPNRTPFINALLPQTRPLVLEQRFMFDAAAASTAIDPQITLDAQHADVSALDSLVSFAVAANVRAPVDVRAVDPTLNNGRKEVAFVDTGVADYQSLVDGIRPGIEIVLLDANDDGLAQMAEWAKQHNGYDAIHLLSHGAAGTLHIGRFALDQASIVGESVELLLHNIGDALTSNGDFLAYGCGVASNTGGQDFIAALAKITGADVAASTNLTGSDHVGGDWTLEGAVGTIDVSTLSFQHYAHSLQVGADGQVDTSFGSAALVKIETTGKSPVVGSTVYEASGEVSYVYNSGPNAGKFLFAADDGSAQTNFYLFRYNADGTPDTTFGTGGKALIASGAGNNVSEFQTSVGSDGKIMLVGGVRFINPSTQQYYKNDFVAIRLLDNGTIDQTFGNSGRLFFRPVNADTDSRWITDITVLADGSTLVAGTDVAQTFGSPWNGFVAKINASGALDTGFDGDGILWRSSSSDTRSSGLVVSGGSGYLSYGGSAVNYIVKFSTTTGAIDTTYGTNGIATYTALAGEMAWQANGMIQQSDGKLVLSLPGANSSTGVTRLVRFNTNGTLDLSFGTAGISGVDLIPAGPDLGAAISQQSDGKILVGLGSSVARFTANGVLDTTFGVNGTKAISFPHAALSNVTEVAATADGGVLVSANAIENGVVHPVILRLFQQEQTAQMDVKFVTSTQTSAPIPLSYYSSVLKVVVGTNGEASPLAATSFTFNTTGTTNVSDLGAATLAYTGENNVFSINTRVGSTVSSPNGTFVITGSQALSTEFTVFWLAYQPNANATLGDVVDAQVTSVSFGGSVWTPLVTAPSGTKAIFNQLPAKFITTDEWMTGSISRIDATGANPALLSSTANGDPSFSNVVVDVKSQKMFISDWANLYSSNLWGDSRSMIVSTGDVSGAIAVDSLAQKVYFFRGTDLYRINTDGTSMEQVTLGGSSVFNYASVAEIDEVNGVMYFIGSTPGSLPAIFKFTYGDSSNALTVLKTFGSTYDVNDYFGGLAIDVANGLLYYSVRDYQSSASPVFTIRKLNFAGTGDTLYLTSSNEVLDLYFHPTEGTLYWSDADGNINKSVVSAGGSTTLFTTGTDGVTMVSQSLAYKAVEQAPLYAPDAPLLTSTSDTGIAGDNLTSNVTPTFRVGLFGTNANGNDTLELLFGGASFPTAVRVTLTATDLLNGYVDLAVPTAGALGSDGVKQITACITRSDGSANATSNTTAITLDTGAPSAPSTPDLTSVSDTGTSNTDNLTNATTPTVTGSGAEAGATVKLYDTDGTTLLGTATADGSGNWSITSSALNSGSHTITAKVTDTAGNESVASAGLILTIDTAVPSAIALSNNSISNSASANTVVGTLSSTDATAGDTFTYALVAGAGSTDNASFAISGSSLQANNPSALSAGSYSVRVRTTDASGNFFEGSLSVTVTSNQAPAVTTPTAIALTDTASTDTFTNQVGTLSATDADGIASYGIQGGTTGGSTTVGAIAYDVYKVGTYGTLYVKSSDGAYVYVPNASAINGRMANTSETFTVIATDSNASSATGTATLTVNVTGVNDFPSDIGLTVSTVGQSGGANVTVGTLSTTDADTGDTHTYTLVSGAGDTNNGLFNISGTSLRVTNAASMAPGTYTMRVQATDAANATYEKALNITIVDDVTPTVASVSMPSNAWYVAGQNLDFTVNFSESVTVDTTSGTPRIELNVGGATVYATYVSGSGTAALTFRYTVQANDLDINGIAVGALGLNGGTLTDTTGNNSVLTLNGVGSTSAVLVDAVNPTAPSTPDLAAASDSGASGTDDITSDNTPTLTGTAEANSMVTLYDTDGATVLGTTTADVSGNWSITSSALSDGNHTIKAKVTDSAGNVSVSSAGVSITVDGTSPSAVALSTTNVPETLSTSGSTVATLSATDSIVLTYSLVIGPGDTDNGGFTITGTDLKAGGSNLVAGTYDIRVRATDAAGNSTEQPFTVTVTSGPSVTSINRAGATPLTNASSVDYTVTYSEVVTGVDASDFALTTTGTAGGIIASISGSGTTYTVTVNALSGDGTLRLDLNNTGTGIVNVGNQAITGGFSSGQIYTLDTTAPTAPSGPNMTAGSDSGSSTTDNITSVTTPTVNGGGAEAGATVKLYDTDGTTVLGTTTADTFGNWSITSGVLADGSHTLKAKVTDAAGNTGAATIGLTVTIDTTVPSAPGAPDLAISSDSGSSTTDNITSVTTPTLTGSGAEAGATVTLYDTNGTTVLGTATVDGLGNWSITSSTLANGPHTLTTKVTDSAGNTSTASAGLTVTIDTTAPAAPSVADLTSVSDTGTSNTDNLTNATTPTVTGSGAEAGATVKLYDTDGTTLLGTAAADGLGNWSITSSTLANGPHTLTTKVTDSAGNTGTASAGLTVMIDTTAPSASGAPDLASGSDTGSNNTDNITSVTTPTLTGSGAEAGATVTLYDTNGTTVLGTATVDGLGNWSITSSTLANGPHTLTTKVTDSAGNTSTASAGLTVTIDTTAPAAPSVADLTSVSDTGTSNTDNLTNATTPTVTGSGAEAGATVKLYDTDGTTLLGTAAADGSGNWSITSSTLANGPHTLTTKVTDTAGNTGSASPGLTITIDTTVPSAIALSANSVMDVATGTNTAVATLSSTDSQSVSYALVAGNGTNDAGNASFVIAGGILQSRSQLTAGTYNIRVGATDAAGNSSYQTFVITVNTNTAPTITSGATASVAENSATSTVVYTAMATDVDIDQTLSYSLTGADAASFDVNATTGVVTLKTPANYEAKTSYSFNVVVTDSGTGNLTDTKAVTVTVTDVNDPNTGALLVSGDVQQGHTLSVIDTLVDQDGLNGKTYQWYADGQLIAGANLGTFTLGQDQVGKVITVKASYTDGVGRQEVVTSAGTVVVVNANDPTTGEVSVSGESGVGQTLTASNTLGDLDGMGAVSYQWQYKDADGQWQNITLTNGLPATGAYYTVESQQALKELRVKAGYTDGQGMVEVIYSTTSIKAGGLPPTIMEPVPATSATPVVPASAPLVPVEVIRPPVSSFILSTTVNAILVPSADVTAINVNSPVTPEAPATTPSRAVVSLGVGSSSGSSTSGLRAVEASRDVVMELGERVSFTLPAGTFIHTDGAARVSLSARLADGRPLPNFVAFDPTTGTFTVDAKPGERAEQLQVVVKAIDEKGQTASTTVVIKLKEKARNSSELDLPIKLGKLALAEQFRMADKPAGTLAELAALSKAFAACTAEHSRA